jgi:hypothetical protein
MRKQATWDQDCTALSQWSRLESQLVMEIRQAALAAFVVIQRIVDPGSHHRVSDKLGETIDGHHARTAGVGFILGSSFLTRFGVDVPGLSAFTASSSNPADPAIA